MKTILLIIPDVKALEMTGERTQTAFFIIIILYIWELILTWIKESVNWSRYDFKTY